MLARNQPTSRIASVVTCVLVAVWILPLLTPIFGEPGDRNEKRRTILDLSEKELHHFYSELKGLKFAETQDELPRILQKVGDNESALLRNIPNLSSKEEVIQEEAHYDNGGVFRGFPLYHGKYSYLVLAHQEADGVRLNEYRTDLGGKESRAGLEGAGSLTQGFALLPLHFHPFHQAVATFRYLGRQTIDHQDTYVVAFAQDQGRAQLTGQVNINGKTIPIAYQGIGWIEPTNFQILHMRTDLLEPRPDVGLGGQTTQIQFEEVRLPTVASPLWLPRVVVVTSYANDRVLRNKHNYSDYKRFTAESKIVPAADAPENKK
ncbi:MAG TPA: hypothetical protein VGF08_04960 [Terriglobales bacterium]|jgi:hypothetical protein